MCSKKPDKVGNLTYKSSTVALRNQESPHGWIDPIGTSRFEASAINASGTKTIAHLGAGQGQAATTDGHSFSRCTGVSSSN